MLYEVIFRSKLSLNFCTQNKERKNLIPSRNEIELEIVNLNEILKRNLDLLKVLNLLLYFLFYFNALKIKINNFVYD